MSPHHLRLLGVSTLAIGLAWSIAIAYAVHPAMPFNPVRLPFADRIEVQVWAPEGWGFFTRSPRERDVLVFARGPDRRWRPASSGPHARPAHLFGVRRTSRAQGAEIGTLLYDLRRVRVQWLECTDDPSECLGRLSSTTDPVGVENRARARTLCGPIGIAMQEPLPWAWSSSSSSITMPSRVLSLAVAC